MFRAVLPTADRFRNVVLAGGLLLLQAAGVYAAGFSIDRTRVELTPRAASALVRLRNESTEPLRLQISAFAWTQRPDGQMDLQPTDDVIFFPALLTLTPGQDRPIRIGTSAAFVPVERSYRVFIEELPPEQRPAADQGVRVLTRMGIPVFLAPTTARAEAVVRELQLSKGTFSFTLANTGTVHFVPDTVQLTASDASGRQILERALRGWYVLPGGMRVFTLTFDAPDCQSVRSLQVHVQVGAAALKERLETPSGACVP
jgi:fimbrial chaperone protein